MLRFLLTRIGLLIPTFIGVSIIAFAFIRLLPGDPIILMAGERGMSEARYAELQTLYGYNQPVVVQDQLTGTSLAAFLSKMVTTCPRLARNSAVAAPAGPAPSTTTDAIFRYADSTWASVARLRRSSSTT